MSIWSDIHRRSNGHQERKEDKIFNEDKKVNKPNLWNWDFGKDWEEELNDGNLWHL